MNDKKQFMLDFTIKNYVGCGAYNEEVIRSVYAADYIIIDGEIKVIQTEFTKEEFEAKKEMLIAKARKAYDKMHKQPLNNFVSVREVKT